jgi:hypothetical protein
MAAAHRTWGDYFLWSYADVRRHLSGCAYEIEPMRVDGLLQFNRVPRRMRPLVSAYVRRMPSRLLPTAMNPWVLALIKRT